ncbi:MAG: addiction module protein [Deltaproteobacteria bacterium]|nr:addiction module protein [Deltaproteobacteria bacterium]
MSRSAAEVLEAALALPEEQRATIVEKLLASLDGAVDADSETQWAVEIERRIARIEAGQAKSVSVNASLGRLQRIARGG